MEQVELIINIEIKVRDDFRNLTGAGERIFRPSSLLANCDVYGTIYKSIII